jgi:dihydrolipoamide dehydrogenase
VRGAQAGATGVTIDMESAAGSGESLTVDTLLVAIGRAPVTDALGAAEAGLAMESGFITVDGLFRTNVPGISAVGDVIRIEGRPHPQLAHLSSAEGVVLAERLAGRDTAPIDYDQVPACTFCDPEIGSVGLTEREALERGYRVQSGTFPFGVLGRAKIAGEVEGFVKIVAEKQYDQVLGVHMIGPRATELVAEATLALRLESTVEELIRTIHAHPTMSEAVGEAAHAVHGTAIHV